MRGELVDDVVAVLAADKDPAEGAGVADPLGRGTAVELGGRAVRQVRQVALPGVDDQACPQRGRPPAASTSGGTTFWSWPTSLPRVSPKPPGRRKSRCMSMITRAVCPATTRKGDGSAGTSMVWVTGAPRSWWRVDRDRLTGLVEKPGGQASTVSSVWAGAEQERAGGTAVGRRPGRNGGADQVEQVAEVRVVPQHRVGVDRVGEHLRDRERRADGGDHEHVHPSARAGRPRPSAPRDAGAPRRRRRRCSGARPRRRSGRRGGSRRGARPGTRRTRRAARPPTGPGRAVPPRPGKVRAGPRRRRRAEPGGSGDPGASCAGPRRRRTRARRPKADRS